MFYKYKIQWIFSDIKEVEKIFNIIPVRGLDSILLRDNNLKIVDKYSDFLLYETGIAEKETIKYLKKEIKNNIKIKYIELFRK
jgi:hypothetical protein